MATETAHQPHLTEFRCPHRSGFAVTASSWPQLSAYHYVYPTSIYPMTRSDPIRRTLEQGICAIFQAVTYSSASGLDTDASDMRQTDRRQANLVHVLCVFACSSIRPLMLTHNSCWLDWTQMSQASYQYPSARRHGTVPAFHTTKLTSLRQPGHTTRTPPAAAEPDRCR